MKIGLVCPYNIFKGGGVQECVLALQAEYEKRGYIAKIITPRPRTYTGKSPDSIILVGLATDVKTLFHTTVQASVSMDSKELDALLEIHKFDVLHFHEPWVPIISRQILSRLSTVNIATFHAKLPDTVMSKTIERVITPYTKSILKYITAFTAVSEAAAEYASSLTTRQIEIIPNGIDLSKYRYMATKRDPNLIVYIGRLERRKGVRYLIDAFAVLKKSLPYVKLIIAGDGVDREKLQHYVHEQKINDVSFKGYVSDKEKMRLLNEAAVFCSPALYGESFGIVLLEAMAKGVPIVAGNNPGYASVLKEKGQLSLVNPKDTTEFARRLQLFLIDKDIRRLWLTWAKDYIMNFSYQQVADEYLAVYKLAVKHKKNTSSTSI